MTFTIQDTKFQLEFNRRIQSVKNPRPMLMGAGREVANLLKSHFRAKDRREKNKLSDRRSHFWLAVSRTVQNPIVAGNTVTVSINDERFPQKVFGGTIRAKNAGALTIPVEERAYGRTTQAFEAQTGLKLFLLRTGKGNFQNAVLAVKDQNAKGFTVEYILTKSVTQQADTDALPQKSKIEAAILSRAQLIADRENAGKSPNPETP